jgi:excisionase family DNA binding protein
MTEPLKPVLCSVPEAARILGLSRSKTYELIGQRQLVTVTIGRRRLVRIDSIETLASRGEAA